MMYFMIDYENVKEPGLDGLKYLTPDDSLIIFISSNCKNITTEKMHKIYETGCNFEIYKLRTQGKNALDFYIASKTGEVYGSGYDGTVAIISNDNGFKSVRDFWDIQEGEHKHKIALGSNIQNAIVALKAGDKRSTEIQNALAKVDIEHEYEKYKEKGRVRMEIENLFADTDYSNLTESIMAIISNDATAKIVYLNSLKRFGRKKGTEIYRTLKEII